MNDLALYYANRDVMDTGDVLQWHSDELLGFGIRVRKGGNVNHTGLVLRLREYEDEERNVFTLEALAGGVVLNRLSRRLALFSGQVYYHRLRPEHDKERREIGRRALALVGTPYDYPGIIEEAFGNAEINLDRLFCSEFAWVAETGKTTGEAPDPIEFEMYLAAWFVSPHIPLLLPPKPSSAPVFPPSVGE